MMRAAVVGGAGYAGGELLRLLAGHPCVEVTQVTSERLSGKRVDLTHPPLRGGCELRFVSRNELEPADVVFTALEHGESSTIIDRLREVAPLIVDLSADFRLRDARGYETWYGWTHPRPRLLERSVYGLAELHRDELRQAPLIAGGGCIATAAILGLAPLLRASLLDTRMPVVVEAKVGSSAAGAQAGAATHHPHRSGEMRSYAPAGHRHTAEIQQELGLDGGGPGVALSATAVEAVRGVLVTAHAFLDGDRSEKEIWSLYRDMYAGEPFVRIVKSSSGLHRSPNPKLLAGTNFCDVGFDRDPHSNRLVVTSAIDNLVKGAAGQAVQALNVRCGWDERMGLGFSGIYPL
ncbi:MAG: N-acetyl-gamma-glutamyl-phosphate reductase [Candidatus Dormibacteraeota bacterium]|nr:N-acetyl-gamma-glutamyl-phosphate reductase [Candidatus Dormibacteraeota bacterium]MBV9525709.1 N-acetyl-gamma-glutamyl-phosphate reductase [Candidatus Dormibacteraeota bacterium]